MAADPEGYEMWSERQSDRVARIRRKARKRILIGLLAFVASLLGPAITARWVAWLWAVIGVIGLTSLFQGIAMLRHPEAYDGPALRPPRTPRPDDAQKSGESQALPPAVAYGVLFAAVALFVGVIAYMMYM